MKKEEIEKTLREILVDMTGCIEEQVTAEARAEDLYMDSLDQIDVLMTVEKEFGIYISDEEASRILTFGDAVECITAKVSEQW